MRYDRMLVNPEPGSQWTDWPRSRTHELSQQKFLEVPHDVSAGRSYMSSRP